METLVAIFAKAPIPGQVKTRLHPVLTPGQAAQLHRRLLHNAIAVVAQSGLTGLLCGGSEHAELRTLSQAHSMDFYLQRGADLGERMWHAACHCLRLADAVLIMGSDCPELTARHLLAAQQALLDHDVVLIPATDGGYVLIGCRRQAHQQVFTEVDWGTERVLRQTRDKLQALGLSWAELPPLADLDRPDDLERLRERRPDLLEKLTGAEQGA